MRFNPPPGWPVSPGWAPGQGVAADPSWPAAPPGWKFWIDDSAAVTVQTLPYQGVPQDLDVSPPQGVPQWQPGGPPPDHTTRNVFIALGVGAVLVVALVVPLVVAFGGSASTLGSSRAVANPTAVKPKSDDDQIRAVVADLQSAWNNTDYAAFMKHTCHMFAADSSHSESSFKRDRSKDGEATLEVRSVTVNGDNSDVTVDRKYADQSKARSVNLDFVKEDGEWKMCPK